MAHREFKYVAVVPLECGMPDGSIHLYEPGDYIPADILGRSIGALVLADKVARIIINVDDEDGPAVPEAPEASEPAPPSPDWPGGTVAEQAERERLIAAAADSAHADQEDDGDVDDGTEYPAHLGGGLYKLSDGNTIKGKSKALAAQEALA